MKQQQRVVDLKALDEAALFREHCNPPNTSAFNVLPAAIWMETGEGSPLVEHTRLFLNATRKYSLFLS